MRVMLAYGGVGARVRVMVRGGCLLLRGSEMMHGSMMVTGLRMGQSKQTHKCCLNATDMENIEEDEEAR